MPECGRRVTAARHSCKYNSYEAIANVEVLGPSTMHMDKTNSAVGRFLPGAADPKKDFDRSVRVIGVKRLAAPALERRGGMILAHGRREIRIGVVAGPLAVHTSTGRAINNIGYSRSAPRTRCFYRSFSYIRLDANFHRILAAGKPGCTLLLPLINDTFSLILLPFALRCVFGTSSSRGSSKFFTLNFLPLNLWNS